MTQKGPEPLAQNVCQRFGAHLIRKWTIRLFRFIVIGRFLYNYERNAVLYIMRGSRKTNLLQSKNLGLERDGRVDWRPQFVQSSSPSPNLRKENQNIFSSSILFCLGVDWRTGRTVVSSPKVFGLEQIFK